MYIDRHSCYYALYLPYLCQIESFGQIRGEYPDGVSYVFIICSPFEADDPFSDIGHIRRIYRLESQVRVLGEDIAYRAFVLLGCERTGRINKDPSFLEHGDTRLKKDGLDIRFLVDVLHGPKPIASFVR